MGEKKKQVCAMSVPFLFENIQVICCLSLWQWFLFQRVLIWRVDDRNLNNWKYFKMSNAKTLELLAVRHCGSLSTCEEKGGVVLRIARIAMGTGNSGA